MSTPSVQAKQPAQPLDAARQGKVQELSQPQHTGPKSIPPTNPTVPLGEGSADSQSLAGRESSPGRGQPSLNAAMEPNSNANLLTSPSLIGADRRSLNASPTLTPSALMPHLTADAPAATANASALKAVQLQPRLLQNRLSQPGMGASPEVANPLQQAAASVDQPSGSLGLIEQPAVAPQRWLRTPVKTQQVSRCPQTDQGCPPMQATGAVGSRAKGDKQSCTFEFHIICHVSA